MANKNTATLAKRASCSKEGMTQCFLARWLSEGVFEHTICWIDGDIATGQTVSVDGKLWFVTEAFRW